VVSGFTLLLTSGNTVPVNSTFPARSGDQRIGPVRWFWVLAFLVAALVGFLLFRTRTGTYLLSTGGKHRRRRGAGIHVDRIRLIAYHLRADLRDRRRAVRGPTGGSDPSLQTDLLLSSIAAVVLGGSSLFGGKASVLARWPARCCCRA